MASYPPPPPPQHQPPAPAPAAEDAGGDSGGDSDEKGISKFDYISAIGRDIFLNLTLT